LVVPPSVPVKVIAALLSSLTAFSPFVSTFVPADQFISNEAIVVAVIWVEASLSSSGIFFLFLVS